jgi:hypothetical protein
LAAEREAEKREWEERERQLRLDAENAAKKKPTQGKTRTIVRTVLADRPKEIVSEMLARRRAIFSASRGLKPQHSVDLLTYVLRVCPKAAKVLEESRQNAGLHGAIGMSATACGGFLGKRGKTRTNWKSRWFLFSLPHRRIVYFEDQSLKKESGSFKMEQVFTERLVLLELICIGNSKVRYTAVQCSDTNAVICAFSPCPGDERSESTSDGWQTGRCRSGEA